LPLPTMPSLLRPKALTMPCVTERLSSIGAPAARTISPTRSLELSPSVAGTRPVASILMRATSVSGSVPMTVAR